MDESGVREFLLGNPDFFRRHQDLLQVLKLPHESGKAVSLVERQVGLLREKLRASERKLGELVQVARDNEQLFDKIRQLTLALLDAESLDELGQALEERFRADFQTDAGGLILLTDDEATQRGNTRCLNRTQLAEAAPRFAALREATGGPLRDNEIEALFPLHDARIQSAMVAPVFTDGKEDGDAVALLVLGSADRGYFHDRLGTSFLEYIRAVLGRTLARHLEPPAGAAE